MASVSKADTVDAIAKATDMRKVDVETVLGAFFDYVGDAAKRATRWDGRASETSVQANVRLALVATLRPGTGPDRRIDGDEVLGE